MSNYGANYGDPKGQGQHYQPTPDDKTWAMLAHLSPLVGLGFLGPLIIWLIYKDKSPFVCDQAKEALNFSLAVLIAVLVLCATCIGIIVAPVVSIGAIVYGIMAAIDANKGTWYRYPYTIRMIT
jgi:uncharacterized Tic20 family protein